MAGLHAFLNVPIFVYLIVTAVTKSIEHAHLVQSFTNAIVKHQNYDNFIW